MKLAIILDTDGTDGTVYELESAETIEEEDDPSAGPRRLLIKEAVGTFPIPGAILAAMIGLDPAAPIEAPTRDAGTGAYL